MFKVFFVLVQLCTILVGITLHETNAQNRRENYVPRGDISNDSDLNEPITDGSTRSPRTTPEVNLVMTICMYNLHQIQVCFYYDNLS